MASSPRSSASSAQSYMRGEIIHRARAAQLRDFTGLRYGSITPTDIDGLIEYRGIAYILYEFKMRGQQMPGGQRLALERLCDDLAKTGKTVVVLVGEHDTPLGQDLDCARMRLVEYRYNNVWHTPLSAQSLQDATDEWLDYAGFRAEQTQGAR